MADDEVPFHIISGEPVEPPRDDVPFNIVTPEAVKPADQAPPRTWQDTMAGLGKTARAEVARDVPALLGVPGSIGTFVATDLPTFARNIGAGAAESMGYISPKREEEIKSQPLPWESEADWMKKGYVSPLLGLPTYKGIRTAMGEVYKGVGRPEGAYEPETGPEKVLAKGIEAGIQSVPGKLATMPERVITGAGAGAASEVAGLATEGQPNEGFWRLASALGGGYAGSKVANALLPAHVGRDQIALALAEDLRKGEGPMTWEQIQAAIKDGTPVSLVDMAGPKTLTLLSKMGNVSPSTQTRVGVFNKHLMERSTEAGSRVGESIRDAMGVTKLDADALKQANMAAGKSIRDTLWKSIERSPAAESIFISDPKLMSSENFQEALRRAVGRAGELPEDFNIRPPSITPGKTGTEDKWEHTSRGFQFVPGEKEVAPVITPGNLPFYHQVDRELSAMIKTAQRSGDDQLVAGYKATQNKLRDQLDDAMLKSRSNQTYREIVGASRKTFVGEEAPQAGYEFASSVINSRKNPFKRGDVRREFDAMDPTNQENLRIGVAARIQDGVEGGQLGHIAKKFAEDANFKRDMLHILGPDRYNQIAGSVMRENIIHQADTLKFLAERVTPAAAGITAAGVVSAADVLKAIIHGAGSEALSAPLNAKPFLAGLAMMGLKAGSSYAERRVAEKTLPLALSKDPKDVAKFGELVNSYPQVADLYNRITTTMNQAVQSVAQGLDKQDKAQPAQRKSGGRVRRQAGGQVVGDVESEANRLVSAAEQAKNQNSARTEPLLNSNDSMIAKALEIANHQYEG